MIIPWIISATKNKNIIASTLSIFLKRRGAASWTLLNWLNLFFIQYPKSISYFYPVSKNKVENYCRITIRFNQSWYNNICVNIDYFAVSPLRLWQYLLARWILVLITGTTLSIIASLVIMETGISYTLLFIVAVFSSCLAVVVGLLIGGIANNQISGIAIMKVLNLVIFLIPIAAIFVHDPYQYFFYPFPNYWMFRILKNIEKLYITWTV